MDIARREIPLALLQLLAISTPLFLQALSQVRPHCRLFAAPARQIEEQKPRVRARVTKKSMWNDSRGILRNFHKIGAGSESQM